MTFDEFKLVDAGKRDANPLLFTFATPDAKASMDQIHNVEFALKIKLPATYGDFLHEFGGGAFGYSTIFSADPKGKWYLPNKVSEARRYVPVNLLPFADDFAGGYYAFLVENGVAGEQVLYWNTDGGTIRTEFETILDFIACDAYEPA